MKTRTSVLMTYHSKYMKKEKNKTINSNAVGYLKSFLAPSVKIVDLYVKGKWLWAELSSGVRFGVKNQTLD